jgi:hypothetical protein
MIGHQDKEIQRKVKFLLFFRVLNSFSCSLPLYLQLLSAGGSAERGPMKHWWFGDVAKKGFGNTISELSTYISNGSTGH